MAPLTTDFGELLAGIPDGAWIAISHDEQRVVAYAAELNDALQKAREKGEDNPVVFRKPVSTAALIL